MNERIRELAKRAGHRYIPSSNSGPLRVEYLTPELERFAELIVRECAEVADDGFASSNFGNGITGQQLLKHFGVEE
jgi:hypothetical protein